MDRRCGPLRPPPPQAAADQMMCPGTCIRFGARVGAQHPVPPKVSLNRLAIVGGQTRGVANMLDKTYWLSANKGAEGSKIREPAKSTSPPDEKPACCGQPMNPRLAHARDRKGQDLFLAVWQCQECGQIAPGRN